MKYRARFEKRLLTAAVTAVMCAFMIGSPFAEPVLNNIYVSAADEDNGGSADAPSNDTPSDDTPSDDTPSDDTSSDDTADDTTDDTDDNSDTDIVTINSSQDLINYSQNYSMEPQKYQSIDVSIAITSGALNDLYGFESIGTEDYPFAASFMTAKSTDLSIALDKPLFAYILDSAKIVDSENNAAAVTISRSGSSDSALFAQNVVHDTLASAPADWKINIGSYTDSSGVLTNNSFAGVIGTLGENANVMLTVKNDTSAATNVSSSGDTGLVCGRMESGSSLAAAFEGSNMNYSISSENGNAGGVVGTMESGSTLTLKTAFSFTGELTSGRYAGGLAGSAENAAVLFETNASVSGSISGGSATGGIFGYYCNTNTDANNTFEVKSFDVNCTLNGKNCGGIFGSLENKGAMTISGDGSESIASNRTASDKEDFGGLIGVYLCETSGNSLTISDFSVSADKSSGGAQSFGGFIGWTESAAYIKFSNVNAAAKGCNTNISNFGGLLGYSDKAFIDAENVTVSTGGDFTGGGVIGYMDSGVLRLGEKTDLSGTKAAGGGQIVGTRGNKALIYALYGWKLIRSSEPVSYDDIGSWGAVLRLTSSLREESIFSIDSYAHTVTVNGAGTSVSSLADFAVLALNIQMNDGTASDSLLRFANTSNTSAKLLGSDISVTSDIDLRGTGITGLTRDDGKNAGGNGNAVFTGTLNGNGHTVTLAVGEPYGYRGNESTMINADDTSEGNGYIYRHYYNALFSATGDGAKLCNITIDGNVNVSYRDNQKYFLAGFSGIHTSGSAAIENADTRVHLHLSGNGGTYNFAGGFIGVVAEKINPVISIKDCEISPEIYYEQYNGKFICGGAIGEISQSAALTLTVENVKIGASVTNKSNDNEKKVGGFLGNIANFSGTPDTRSVVLKNISFENASVESEYGGALLGENWNDVDVTVGSETEKGISVKNSSVKQSGNRDFAGIVTAMTGYCRVYDIDIQSITVSGSNANSFGMLVNKGVYKDNSREYALYLEFEKENAYKISSADMSGLNSKAVYDDIIATCTGVYDDGETVLQNGKSAVVSVHTSGDAVIMDGASCNTYQDQTSVVRTNPNSRYYYNLDVIRNKNTAALSSAEKLMLWSVNKYAYENVKQYFTDTLGSTVPAGSYDMTGYSYYPIDVPSSLTIEGGSTFIFRNDEIESGELGTGNSDNAARKTVGERSQHYLMHCGLFRNTAENIVIHQSIIFSGSIGSDSSYSGVLICGTMQGTGTNTVTVEADGIILDGVYVNGASEKDYAPLLINRTDSFSELSFTNVSTTESYRTNGITTAASSLIGNVGNDDGTSQDIRLTFANLTLDGRKNALSDSAANSALNTAYGTDRSVFSKALLLNRFKFKTGSNCSGMYNFTFDEDWNEDMTPKHNVAYGMEISDSAEYDGLQEKYLKSDTFTDPTRPDPEGEYTFKSCFLPYVAASYNNSLDLHEIKVNQSVQASLDEGCGTYNDPYIITYGRQLELLDKVLSGNLGVGEDGTVINYYKDNYKEWCQDRNSHKVLIWNASKKSFATDDGSFSATLTEMQNALSTAYFKLNENVTVSSAEFLGIGKKVPFKGVIFGNGKTVENSSSNPLIFQSVGAVVKDLTVNITADFTGKFTASASSKYETDGDGTAAFYGGVIGIVNGGDNIIDNVGVIYTNAGSINTKFGTDCGNKAVGGYIGIVRYGGVIFRNMESVSAENRKGITESDNPLFKSTGNYRDGQNKLLLYCNPIIGRVIDGYAVTESDAFRGNEADVTMHNGTKNYSITDIDKNADRTAFSSFVHPTGRGSASSGTVTVKNAQDIFLLGCISMSGEGSADKNGRYSSYSFGNGQMNRCALYSEVGTDSTGDFEQAKNDNFAQNAVPYIIYKYTSENAVGADGANIAYPAKSLTNNSFIFNIDMVKGRYVLPDGFRGIGTLTGNAADMMMYINGISGNGSEIVLNTEYNIYYNKSVDTYDKYYNASNSLNNYKVGAGLFTTLVQNKSDLTPTDFAGDTSGKYYISDITFSGNVSYNVYKDEGGSLNYNDAFTSCSGALAGVGTSGNVMTENVKLSDMSVSSCHASGGLMGAFNGSSGNSSVIIKKSSADKLTVTGGCFSGGLIGHSRNCEIQTDGGDDAENRTAFRIDDISAVANFNQDYYTKNYGAGGLFGTVINSDTRIVTSVGIKNIDIEGGNVDINLKGSFIGGVIGCLGDKGGTVTSLEISDVNVTEVDINKDKDYEVYSGGVVGTVKESVKSVVFTDVHMIGGQDKNTVKGNTESGGFIGLLLSDFTADGCSVENYFIIAGSKAEASGGFVAKLETVKTPAKVVKATNCTLSNVSVIQSNTTPVGGLVGYSTKSAKIYGYNILMDNVTVTNGKGAKVTSGNAGDILGKEDTGCELKIVGISMNKADDGIYAGKNTGYDRGTGYVIYADYNNSCMDTSANNEPSDVNTGDIVDDMGALPYVTVNPKNVIDSSASDPKFLTGDGADRAAVDAVISDIGKTNGYANVVNEYKNVFSKYESKLSAFNEKTGSSIPDDIPLLVVNDADYRNITEMLNSYIHIMTNDMSISNYAVPDSNIFEVSILPMRLNEASGIFETSAEFRNTLEYKNGYFKMTDMDYDSNYKQFSLIDIRYFDPADKTKTAYHLYIPVYTEKMLDFDFRAAALSGTVYNTGFYTDGNPVIENYGTPVTAHVTYSYKRTAEEWQNVINSGENLLEAYGKSVLLTGKLDLPSDTKLVLVDRNNHSKAYYSTVGEAFSSSSKKLGFSKFTDQSGNGFVPVSFCELLNSAADISAEQDTEGTLVKCSGTDTSASFKIGEEYFRKRTDTDTDTSKLYTVKLVPKTGMTDASTGFLKLEEDYYISFFTEADNSAPMRNITISCSRRLGDDNMTTSHLDNENANGFMAHMILGNLYDQSFTFKTTGSEVINESNRSLNAELETTISLKPENAGEVTAYLKDSSIHLYHGFVIEAARNDESGTVKGIKGNPRVTGTYRIGSTGYSQNFSNSEAVIVLTGSTSGGVTDIKNQLISGSSVTVSCNDLQITYTDEESIIAQFPERKNPGETYGVTLSASSNLAYVADNIEQSKMSEGRTDGNGKSYYRENIEAATLSYNLLSNSPNEMTKLGINGFDTNDKITAAGYYNVMNIPEETLDNMQKVRFTLSLYQKNNDGGYDAVSIDEYLSDIQLYDKDGSAKVHSTDGGSYVFVFDRSELNYEAGSFEVISDYSVKTGAAFERDKKLYSNYKVMLTAELIGQNDAPVENSGCSDYIVYTNAKIYSQMVSAK